MSSRLLFNDVERGVQRVLVSKSPGRVCRVDVEWHVVRREYGHTRRRCHGFERGTRRQILAPSPPRVFSTFCFDLSWTWIGSWKDWLGNWNLDGMLNVVLDKERSIRTQEIMY